MKIKMTTTVTEIEADARELHASQTLSQNLNAMISRMLQYQAPLDDEGEQEDEEAEEADQ